MAGKRKKPEERPVYDSIRKPSAPPGKRFRDDKAMSKSDKVGRRSKHRRKVTDKETENDG